MKFNKWKNALERFADHESSKYHCDSVLQFNRMTKAYENGRGITIKMSRCQVEHNKRIEGGFLSLLAGLAAKALPLLAKTVLPTLVTGEIENEIETEDFFKDISADVQEKFNTSNFSPNHPSGIPTGINKKVPGKFKDEAGGEIIKEFVGLRVKLYAIKKLDGEEEKKCKGVKRNVIRNEISFNDYKDVLFSGKEVLRTMNVI